MKVADFGFIHQERQFCVLARLSRDVAEAWQRYAAQGIVKTYAARADNSPSELDSEGCP